MRRSLPCLWYFKYVCDGNAQTKASRYFCNGAFAIKHKTGMTCFFQKAHSEITFFRRRYVISVYETDKTIVREINKHKGNKRGLHLGPSHSKPKVRPSGGTNFLNSSLVLMGLYMDESVPWCWTLNSMWYFTAPLQGKVSRQCWALWVKWERLWVPLLSTQLKQSPTGLAVAALLVKAPLREYHVNGLSPPAPATTRWALQTTSLKTLLLGQTLF